MRDVIELPPVEHPIKILMSVHDFFETMMAEAEHWEPPIKREIRDRLRLLYTEPKTKRIQ